MDEQQALHSERPGDGQEPTESETLEALSRVKSSATFQGSNKAQAFLDFVVRTALKHDPSLLKETSIGVGLFGRSADYNPKTDNVVRMQANRVRERLEKYYSGEGSADALIIQMTKGSYVPVFVRRKTELGHSAADRQTMHAGTASRAKVAPFWVAVSLGLALTAALALLLSQFAARSPSKSSGPVAERNRRVVVVPFQGSQAGSEDHLYGHAMADSIVAGLAGIRNLDVVVPKELHDAGAPDAEYQPERLLSLDADFVVTGHFARRSGKSTISIKLTEAPGGGVLWSRRIDFAWADLVKTEQEISDAVASRLSLQLGQGHGSVLKQAPASSLEAHREYLVGYNAANSAKQTVSLDSYSTAERHLKKALELDPDYPDAHATLAGLLLFRALPWTRESHSLLSAAEGHVQAALSRAPRSSEALAAQARSRVLRRDLQGAFQAAKRAVEAEPSNVDALSALADVYTALGLYESALQTYVLASQNTPTATEPFVYGSILAAQLGRREDAARFLKGHAQVDPGGLFQVGTEGAVQLRLGDPAGAETKYRKVREVLRSRQVPASFKTGPYSFADVSIALALVRQRKPNNAVEILRELGPPLPRRVSDEILLLAALNHKRTALQAIEESFHHGNYRFLVTEQGLKPLYGEPEFRRLLERSYPEWISLLKETGGSLPAKPPDLPAPTAFLQAAGIRRF